MPASLNPDFSSSLSFLSTHPPAPDRLAKLKQLLPYAEARYRGEAIPNAQQLPTGSKSGEPLKNDTPPVAQLNPPPGDSFDFSRPDQRSNSVTVSKDGLKDFKVIADRSFLFVSPSDKSRRIGEFRRGGMLSGYDDKLGCVRAVRPDHGYVNLSDLVEIYSK